MTSLYIVLLAVLVPAQPAAKAEGPCSLLPTADVKRAFPGSTPGVLNRTQEKYGVLTCLWSSPTGQFSIVAGTGEDSEPSVKDEAETWTLTFLDPLRRDAARHVRYESLPGVGDEALAVVEREDKAKGFMQNGAVLVVRRGRRVVTALSTDLARRDRGEALKVFQELGKTIAKRLE
jgi:hypothetical protein